MAEEARTALNAKQTSEVARAKVQADAVHNAAQEAEAARIAAELTETVRIEFEEDVYGVEDPAGTILLKGRAYRIADPLIDYVLAGDVAL